MCDKSTVSGLIGGVSFGVATYAIFAKAATYSCIEGCSNAPYPMVASIIAGLIFCVLITFGRFMQSEYTSDINPIGRATLSFAIMVAGMNIPSFYNVTYNYFKSYSNCNQTWDLVLLILQGIGIICLILIRLI